MKHLPLITTITTLLFSANSFSQSNLQIGAQGVFSKTKGWGGEIVGNVPAAKNFSIGIGARPIKFEEHSKLYLPVFASAKYYHTLPKYTLFASLDPGYGIYPSEDPLDGSYMYYRKGSIYLSGSVSITGNSKLAPYASIHFAKFGFTENYGSFSQYRPISTFTFSAGIMLNSSARQWVFTQRKNPIADLPTAVIIKTPPDYLKRSKRQRTTGRILLANGIALIGSGFIVAAQEDDSMAKAISIIFLGGQGLISSLISIPFFTASARNKREALKF